MSVMRERERRKKPITTITKTVLNKQGSKYLLQSSKGSQHREPAFHVCSSYVPYSLYSAYLGFTELFGASGRWSLLLDTRAGLAQGLNN